VASCCECGDEPSGSRIYLKTVRFLEGWFVVYLLMLFNWICQVASNVKLICE
jgi:hypothetical protein